jgi:hypothetical protein
VLNVGDVVGELALLAWRRRRAVAVVAPAVLEDRVLLREVVPNANLPQKREIHRAGANFRPTSGLR